MTLIGSLGSILAADQVLLIISINQPKTDLTLNRLSQELGQSCI